MKAFRFAVLVAGLLLLRPPDSHAQAPLGLLWDTNPGASGAQGGTGNWLGAPNWNTIFSNTTWSDGSGAVFGATPGTVTVNGPVTTDRLTFNVNGYTVSGASTLTVQGATSTIAVTNAGDTATISAPLGGSVNLTKVGAGTLTLSGTTANTYTGTAMVTDGTLNLSKSGVNALTGGLIIGDSSGATASAIVVQGANNQIPDMDLVTINQDGFWNLASGNRSETIGVLYMQKGTVATGAGTLTLNSHVRTFRANNIDFPKATISGLLNLGGGTRSFITDEFASLVVSAAISNGGLTIQGYEDYSVTLGGTVANSYSGATTVNQGILDLDKPAGVTAIAGDLIISGNVLFSSYVRQFADNQIADTATVTITEHGTWLSTSSETIAGLVMTGSDIVNGVGTLTVNGSVTTNASVTSATINGKLNLAGATHAFDIANGTAASDLNVSEVISGGSLTKVGSGCLTLSAVNTFAGPLAINGGVVSIAVLTGNGVNGNLGAGNSISFDGGTLSITATSSSATDRAVALNAGGGTVNVANAAGAVTITSALSGVGGLTKTGPGTLALGGTNANTYAGATMVADGTLNLSKPASVNAIPGNLTIGDGSGAAASAIVTQGADEQIPDTTAVAIVTDGFWNLASGNRSETIATLTMTAGSIATGSGTLTVNGNVATNANAVSASISGQLSFGGATRTFDIGEGTAAFDLDIAAEIANGPGGFIKTGAGMLRLSGGSAFSGPVAINAGTLIARNGSAIGDNSDVTVANVAGATLSIDGAETIGSLAGGGSVALDPGSTLNVGGGNSTTFSGSMSGAGGLTKSGAGTLTLSNAPTYFGNTLITAGTLVLNSGIANAAGSMTVNAPGILQGRSTVNRPIGGDGTIIATATLTIGDPSSTAGFAFDGTLAVGSNFVALSDAGMAELGIATTLGAGGRLDSLNGAVLGSGESVIVSASVSASISGSFTNNGTVNGPTSAGQTLTFVGDVNGTGSYTGRVTFSDGFSPGLSAAAISLETFQLDPTATLSIELGGVNAGTEFDQLNFTGAGLLDGMLSVSLLNGFNPQPGNAFAFIQGGGLAGAFDTMNLPPLAPGFSWSYSQTASGATLAVVPEPAFGSLLAAGALAMALVRRRRSCVIS